MRASSSARPRYARAFAAGDPENTAVWFGEAAGLIRTIKPAANFIESMVAEAAALLERRGEARAILTIR